MVILAGILLIFMLITACSPNKAFIRNDKPEQSSRNITEMPQNGNNSYAEYENDSEFNYDTETPTSKDNVSNNERFYQTGYASWYGREFHGRKTASGDRFDMNKFTAAHKKLPFGTQLIVKNLENGKSVRVTVNDRGPYEDGRIIDLSYAAARKLGIISSGEAKVGLIIERKGENDTLAREYKSSNTESPVVGVAYNKEDEYPENDFNENYRNSNAYSIQAGAFYSRKNAERLQKKIETIVDNPVVVFSENDMYKIRINKIRTKGHANRIKSLLDDQDISSFIVENRE